MPTIVSFSVDLLMIGLLIAAIVFAIKLSQQLAGLRQSRAEMERFILEFNSTVTRAEAGIRGLKQAARSSGDDLEKLIDHATEMRDEITFLIEAADQTANRLTERTSQSNPRPATETKGPSAAMPEAPKPATLQPVPPTTQAASPAVASGAERELLRVLGKLR